MQLAKSKAYHLVRTRVRWLLLGGAVEAHPAQSTAKYFLNHILVFPIKRLLEKNTLCIPEKPLLRKAQVRCEVVLVALELDPV